MNFICPRCKQPVKKRKDSYICTSCESLYNIWKDIPVFSLSPDQYYGEIKREEMERLFKLIESSNLYEGLSRYFGERESYIHRYLFSQKRTAFRLLLEYKDKHHVLDFGSGWGTLARSYADYFNEIVAADMTPERIYFARLFYKAEGVDNIIPVIAGFEDYLPFEDSYFDVVVLNGVLEWIPEYKKGNPEEVQIKFLKEINRILKPDGLLYIGIENRIGYRYFLGRREDHTNLRFGSLLPRFIANTYSKLTRGKEYRTYTYSQRGYRKLLEKAGFFRSVFYLPKGDYRFIEGYLYPVKLGNLYKYFARREGRRFFSFLKATVARFFYPSFSILVKKKTEILTFLDELRSDLSFRINNEINNIDLEEVYISSTGIAVIDISNRGKDDNLIAKVPLDKQSEKNIKREAEILAMISLFSKDERIPRFIASENLNGFKYTIQTKLKGNKLNQKILNLEQVSAILNYLERFRTESRSFIKDAKKEDTSKIQYIWDFNRMSVKNKISATAAEKLSRLSGLQNTLLKDYADFESVVHGDFWFDNLLWDKDDLTGVVDWSTAFIGPSIIDLLTLLIMQEHPDGDPNFGILFSKLKNEELLSRQSMDLLYQVIEDQSGRFDKKYLDDIVYIYAVYNIMKRLESVIYRQDWILCQVEPILEILPV